MTYAAAAAFRQDICKMSLFDLLETNGVLSPTSEPLGPVYSSETTLGILDETLQSIYGVGQGRAGFSSSSPSLLTDGSRPITVRASVTVVSVKELAPSKSVGDLSDRLSRLTVQTPSAAELERKQARDADLEARNALRELSEEVELLRIGIAHSNDGNNSSSAELSPKEIAGLLFDKYIRSRLVRWYIGNVPLRRRLMYLWFDQKGELPGTPFVLLARKKTQLKIDQLRCTLEAKTPATSSANANASTNEPARITDSNGSNNHDEWWRRVHQMISLPSNKQEALGRLVALPESQLRRLPAPQRELAAFAKRLDSLVQLPEELRRQLPVEHQRILDELRKRRRS